MKRPPDPYHDRNPYHYAHLITEQGDVSALCFTRPHPIDMTRACWTIRDEAVTCPRCLKKMQERHR